MFNQLREALSSFVRVFADLPLGKKIAISAVSALMLIGILLTAYLAGAEDYSILYSNLSAEDTLGITEKLKERRIPYRLERAGTVISVPRNDVYELRLELAGEGLPAGGGVGFEIFDKTTFGMTEFVQNLNYIRGLQGELQRTINAMGPIDFSRVHIAIPKRVLFDEEAARASASIVLKLKGGRRLSQGQVDSISHLVASSVEGLDIDNITMVDMRGNLLLSPQDADDGHRLSVKQLEYKNMVEKNMEKRIRTMLERTVGIGRAVVRVSARMDFRQVQKTEEIYDPASQVARSEQRSEEKTSGTSFPSGVAGVQSNLPGVTLNEPLFSKPATSSRINETINYEINKTVQTIIEPTAVIKNLSVAVLIDGQYKVGKDAEGRPAREFQPLAQEEKARLENLIRSAIGFDPERQDSVTIESMRFDIRPTEEGIEELTAMSEREFITRIIEYVGLGLAGLVVLFFVLRPLLGWITSSSTEVEELRTFPKTVADMEKELEDLTKAPDKKIDFRQKVSEIVADNPEVAANLVRAWLKSRI